MPVVKKFLFDNEFDSSGPPQRRNQEELADHYEPPTQAPEPEPEPPAPTFSEEDMANARTKAFTEGKAEGVRESMATIERQASAALAAIGQQLVVLTEAQEKANHDHQVEAMTVAVAVVRKLFPDMASHNALGEVERLVNSAMERLTADARVTIRVADVLKAPLEERLATVVQTTGFEGRLLVIADSGLAPGDCRLDWGDGGADRDTAALWREIDEILERNRVPAAASPDAP